MFGRLTEAWRKDALLAWLITASCCLADALLAFGSGFADTAMERSASLIVRARALGGGATAPSTASLSAAADGDGDMCEIHWRAAMLYSALVDLRRFWRRAINPRSALWSFAALILASRLLESSFAITAAACPTTKSR